MNTNYVHSDLTGRIIKAYYDVYNTLGFGFLEKVYENSMMIKLKELGLEVVQQRQLNVYFEGEKVGHYYADIIVDEKVIVEIKAAKMLIAEHEAQLVNYLRATDIEVGLLINFGKTPDIRKRVLTNDYKPKKS